MLFSEFNTNYNDEPEIHKKGTVIYKEKVRSCGFIICDVTCGKYMRNLSDKLMVSLVVSNF